MNDFDTYYGLLKRLHEHLQPSLYVEIGVHKGHSLAFVQPGTEVHGVDPEPIIEVDLPADCTIHAETSDAFFAAQRLADRAVDLTFVDGLHVFEQALRDVANAEAASASDSVILVHDCLPIDARTSTRERNTLIWSGDVWKVMAAIREHRPDLSAVTVDVGPTGLGIISGLDPTSSVLTDNFDAIVEPWVPLGYDDLVEQGIEATLGVVPPVWSEILQVLPR